MGCCHARRPRAYYSGKRWSVEVRNAEKHRRISTNTRDTSVSVSEFNDFINGSRHIQNVRAGGYVPFILFTVELTAARRNVFTQQEQNTRTFMGLTAYLPREGALQYMKANAWHWAEKNGLDLNHTALGAFK
jgi:hypothetical protein